MPAAPHRAGSPWQNPFVECSATAVRDEVLSVEAFDSVLEAQTVIIDWELSTTTGESSTSAAA
jgi:hypothetical protein